MKQSLRILVTNISVAGHRGARSVTRDLMTGLLRAGHQPMLFSPNLGPLANDLRALSIPVSDDIANFRELPDIIHGQHYSVTTMAVARFPTVPAIFVCHDFIAWHDAPPRLPQIRRWAAISDGFRERLTVEGGIEAASARVVLNAVALDRYRPGPPLPDRPRRALAFAKNLAHLPAVKAACEARGLELEVVGGAVGKVVAPHEIMGDYDIVFASALTAIEAMATGRAVVVCDGRGMAGMVDAQRYPGWRRENFGLRTLLGPLTPDAVAAELDRYDPAQAAAVSARIRADAGLPQWIGAWEALYQEAIEAHRTQPLDPDAAARAMAAHLQSWSSTTGPGFPWMVERAGLIEAAEMARHGLRPLASGESAVPGDPTRMNLSGFSPPEPWGAWSIRRVCSVGLRLAPEIRRLKLDYRPRFPKGQDRFDFELLANGLPLEPWSIERGAPEQRRVIELPEDCIDDSGRLWLTFHTTAPVAPVRDMPGADHRTLGFGLIGVAAD